MTAGARPARVLIVDDNVSLVDNLAEILAESGYEVRTAGSCAEALEAGRDGFDVALVDIKLPDGDGTQLVRPLRERTGGMCEVVLLTGIASVESAQAAVRAGAAGYLMKPCSTPELLTTLEQGLRQVRLRQEKHDLTQRAQRAEKLAAVGTLTAGLSHEIRNPLNSAGLQLTVLERRIRKLPPDLQPPLLEPLTLARDEVTRLDHILEDFLRFARPRPFKPQPVELEPMVRRVSDLLRPDAESRQIRFEHRVAPRLRVLGDEEQLRQVLMNLALNALQATPNGGEVAVSAERSGEQVQLHVEDSGPGVPPEIGDRIFEPFFTTKPQGTGLGLPIVHAIVLQHGGTIELSRSPKGGARFTLRLPLAD